MRSLRGAAGVVSAGFIAACATTGSTLGSGVGDSYIEHPPFYAGRTPGSQPARAIGFLPVAFQRGASQPEIFDPKQSSDVHELLGEMTLYLADLGLDLRPLPIDAFTSPILRGAPDVMFGCLTETGFSDDDCAEREDESLGRGSQPMRLAVGRPSPEWVAAVQQAMTEAGVEQTLVLTLEIGQYWIRQRGLRGTKEVELGTNHTVRFPWLTSLEGPVPVVQITGALVAADGKAVRIGAEGVLARRTPMRVSALGATALVADQEMAELRRLRREDLPSQPLAWEEALRLLVTQLTGTRTE